MSMHGPVLENDDLWSVMVVEPTVMAEGAEAGDLLHASPPSLPAATTTTTPALVALSMAAFVEVERLPPSDMDSTMGVSGLANLRSVT